MAKDTEIRQDMPIRLVQEPGKPATGLALPIAEGAHLVIPIIGKVGDGAEIYAKILERRAA